MSDIFVSSDRWICEKRVSLGVKEISGAERQILSVRFPFHRVRVAYSEGGELKYKVLKVCGTVRAGGSNRNSGSGASIVFSRGQQLTGGTHADKLVYRGDRNRRSEKRCRLRATCSPLPPTRQLVAAPFPPSLPSRSADLSLPFRDTLRSCLAIVGLPGDARSGVRIAPRLQSSGPTHHTILAVCPVRPATPKERLAAQTRQQRPRPPNAAPRERAAHSRHSSRLAVPLDTRLGPASTEPCEHGVARHRRLLREWDEQAV